MAGLEAFQDHFGHRPRVGLPSRFRSLELGPGAPDFVRGVAVDGVREALVPGLNDRLSTGAHYGHDLEDHGLVALGRGGGGGVGGGCRGGGRNCSGATVGGGRGHGCSGWASDGPGWGGDGCRVDSPSLRDDLGRLRNVGFDVLGREGQGRVPADELESIVHYVYQGFGRVTVEAFGFQSVAQGFFAGLLCNKARSLKHESCHFCLTLAQMSEERADGSVNDREPCGSSCEPDESGRGSFEHGFVEHVAEPDHAVNYGGDSASSCWHF